MAGRPRTRNFAYIGVDFFGQQFQLFGRQLSQQIVHFFIVEIGLILVLRLGRHLASQEVDTCRLCKQGDLNKAKRKINEI